MKKFLLPEGSSSLYAIIDQVTKSFSQFSEGITDVITQSVSFKSSLDLGSHSSPPQTLSFKSSHDLGSHASPTKTSMLSSDDEPCFSFQFSSQQHPNNNFSILRKSDSNSSLLAQQFSISDQDATRLGQLTLFREGEHIAIIEKNDGESFLAQITLPEAGEIAAVEKARKIPRSNPQENFLISPSPQRGLCLVCSKDKIAKNQNLFLFDTEDLEEDEEMAAEEE